VTAFIILCALLALLATGFLLVPLLRSQSSADAAQPPVGRSTPAAIVLGLALPLAALGLYKKISNFDWTGGSANASAAAPAGHGTGSGAAALTEALGQLEARLKDNPNDAEGWRMLGRSYVVTGQPEKAVAAYERAIAAGPPDKAAVSLDLAEALVLTNDPAQQDRARGIIDAALAADPKEQKALWYAGVMAYRRGDMQTAQQRWMTLLEQRPPLEIQQILVTQLQAMGASVPAEFVAAAQSANPQSMVEAPGAEAANEQGTGPSGAQAQDGTQPVGRTIRVKVSIDPSLAAKAAPGTAVFIAAREPGIPGPPLAVIRTTADQLPTTVTLSDANAMIEGRNLSSVADVEVVARVAFGGTARTETGDLIGTAVQTKDGAGELAVTINRVQP
jgi:cytochrome c-type biogenesis protein CcmH